MARKNQRKSSGEEALNEMLEKQKKDEAGVGDIESTDIVVQGLAQISKKVKESVVNVRKKDLRGLIDSYYQTQKIRIGIQGQIRAINQGVDDKSNKDYVNSESAMQWLLESKKNEETQIKNMLTYYVKNQPVGRWMMDITGIGPVLAAAMLCYFDISKCDHVNQFWSYAGLNDNVNPWLGQKGAKAEVKAYLERHPEEDPHDMSEGIVAYICDKYYRTFKTSLPQAYDQKKLERGIKLITKTSVESWLAKPPYNKDLKTLCWKIGESFLKQTSREKSLYGYKIMRDRFEYESAKNKKGDYAKEAEKQLRNKNWSNKKIKEIYESGHLPDGHIWSRCKRYATKMFIAHLFEAMWWHQYHTDPPMPFAIAIQGHIDYIPPEVDYRDPKYGL